MTKNKLTQDDIGILIFISSFFLGAFFRLYPPRMSGFPISDGALFLRAIESIQENNFKLPSFINYNQLNIPFAYPPLAFYIAGAISSAFQIPPIQVMTWMPAIVLVLTLPFVFFLARLLTNSIFQASIAVFFYALLPRTILWFIMGGGITRSLGHLLLIIASSQLYLLIIKRNRQYIFSSIVFCSLVTITHPEAALHTILTGMLIWAVFDKSINGIKRGILVGLGTLILTSPWWALVLSRFGLSPFISAGKTGLQTPFVLLNLLENFGAEKLLTLIAALAILGFFHQISKKEPFLPAWYFIPFLIEPRNAPNVVTIPMAILASIFLTEKILPGLSTKDRIEEADKRLSFFSVKIVFLAYLSLSLSLGMILFDTEISNNIVSPDIREAFMWLNKNTPAESNFLVITGKLNLFGDYINEWFPYFAQQKSQTTIQGNEWLHYVDFNHQINILRKIQNCVNSTVAIECIENVTIQNQVDVDYILIIKDEKSVGALLSDLISQEVYIKVYESPETVIFSCQTGQAK